jgi:hypothetical protein
MLKGPAVSESDNLNPWHWKRERAPRSKNTAPSISQTSVTFERMEALHNGYAGVPEAAGELTEQREIKVLDSAEQPSKPLLQETVNTQGCEPVLANTGSDLGPQVLSHETIGVQSAPTLSTEGALNPATSKDLLEDYEERFFLKQDGYDDP